MRFLSLPKIIIFFASIFSRKNCENQRFQLPKMLPKSVQNAFKIDVPQNLHFFVDFLLILVVFGFVRFFFEVFKTQQKLWFCCITSISALCVCRNMKQRENIKKNYQKPFQNEVRTMKKSMSKTCCFLTSIFGGSGLDFGGSWASNLEPSWLKIAISSILTALFVPS